MSKARSMSPVQLDVSWEIDVSWELDLSRTHFDVYRSGKIGMQRRQPTMPSGRTAKTRKASLRHRRNLEDIVFALPVETLSEH